MSSTIKKKKKRETEKQIEDVEIDENNSHMGLILVYVGSMYTIHYMIIVHAVRMRSVAL